MVFVYVRWKIALKFKPVKEDIQFCHLTFSWIPNIDHQLNLMWLNLFQNHLYLFFAMFIQRGVYSKKEIWLRPMTKAPTPTEKSKKQCENTKTPPKTSISQRLRTNLGRSVGITIVTQLVWLNRFTDPNLPTNYKIREINRTRIWKFVNNHPYLRRTISKK